MLHFIAIDTDEKSVDLYTEGEFKEKYGDDDLEDIEAISDDVERATALADCFGCSIAWCRDDAIDEIISEIETLSVEDGDGEEVADLAKMIVKVAGNDFWDLLIEQNPARF